MDSGQRLLDTSIRKRAALSNHYYQRKISVGTCASGSHSEQKEGKEAFSENWVISSLILRVEKKGNSQKGLRWNIKVK